MKRTADKERPHEDQRAQSAQGQDRRVRKGTTTAHVRIDVSGKIITAAITNQSVDDLGLAVGKDAHAVIKASDVMVAVD